MSQIWFSKKSSSKKNICPNLAIKNTTNNLFLIFFSKKKHFCSNLAVKNTRKFFLRKKKSEKNNFSCFLLLNLNKKMFFEELFFENQFWAESSTNKLFWRIKVFRNITKLRKKYFKKMLFFQIFIAQNDFFIFRQKNFEKTFFWNIFS